jgi:hypothetical protein
MMRRVWVISAFVAVFAGATVTPDESEWIFSIGAGLVYALLANAYREPRQ